MEVLVKRDKLDGKWGVIQRYRSPCEYIRRFESGEMRNARFDAINTRESCGCPVTGKVGFAFGELGPISACSIGARPIRFNGFYFHVIGSNLPIRRADRVIFLSNGICVAEGIS